MLQPVGPFLGNGANKKTTLNNKQKTNLKQNSTHEDHDDNDNRNNNHDNISSRTKNRRQRRHQQPTGNDQ